MIKSVLNSAAAKSAAPTHYHFVVDVSGSMHYDLPRLREDLKNLIGGSLRQDDLFSLIYYSSKGDYGHIVKGFKFNGIDSINMAHNAIENLRSRSLTGFVDPLTLVKKTTTPETANVMIFMSDGYENQSPESQVLSKCSDLKDELDAAFIIEYGDYANHDLLTKMVDAIGGTFVYAKDFTSYNENIEKIVKSEFTDTYVEVVDDNYNAVFTVNNGMVRVFNQTNGVYKVPENAELYLDNGVYDDADAHSLLALTYINQMRGNATLVFELLGRLGDKYLIDMYSGAIGKQKVNAFLTEIQELLSDDSNLYRNGKDTNYLPDANEYCLFDLFEDFNKGDNYIFTRHEDFKYKRIGSKKVQASSELTAADKEVLASEDITLDKANAVLSNKYQLNFEYADEVEAGHKLRLEYNTKRANISFQVKHDVTVDLSQIPNYDGHMTKIKSHIFRNYALIKDMVLNISHIVVKLDEATLANFTNRGLIEKSYNDGKVLLNISLIPVVNRAMIENFDDENFIELNYQYLDVKYAMRVLNGLKKEYDPKKADYLDQYSEDFIEWLKDIGIDHNGFNPKTVSLTGSDEYYADEVLVKFAKIGSIPTPAKVLEKYNESKKLTEREQMLFTHIQKFSGIENDLTLLNETIKKYSDHKSVLEMQISKSMIQMFLTRYVPENDGKFSFDDYSGQLVINEKTVKL